MPQKSKNSFGQIFYAIKILDKLLGTKFNIDGIEKIQNKPTLFVANHFTRVETVLLPYIIFKYCKKQTRSLADSSLFKGMVGDFLTKSGCIATDDPNRNNKILSNLIKGDADWIIYPEGSMVKNKKIIDKGDNQIFLTNAGENRVRTGSAVLALKAELIKKEIQKSYKDVYLSHLKEFNITDKRIINNDNLQIIPINITYYPIRPGKNSIQKIANRFIKDLPKKLSEELEIEGNLLLSSNINISFLDAIDVNDYINKYSNIIYNIPILHTKNKRNLTIKHFKNKLTNKFMYQIYSNTRINFDHLFTSAIFYFPEDKISIKHLKKIIYYSGFLLKKSTNFRLGDSIKIKNLSKLLDDEEQHNFEDIVKLAIDCNIIRKNKKYFEINRENINFVGDFHNVRIDNTISVIMNEFSILTKANNIIRNIAKINEEKLNNNISLQIIGQNLKEYDIDYDKFYNVKLSKHKEKNQPFFLNGKKDTGILLCHGYGSTPREVQDLAIFLNNQGYKIYAPRLKGHATSPENIKYITWQDWYDSVNSGFNILNHNCKKIIPIGFSTGALLCLLMAAKKHKNKKITSLVSISAAIKLKDIKSILVPGVNIWNDILSKFKINKGKLEYVTNRPENPHINYNLNYLKGVEELGELMSQVTKNLEKIKIPSLIIHAKDDPIVYYKSSEIIHKKIATKDKKLIEIDSDKHVIITNKNTKDNVFCQISDFLNKYE